MALVGLAVRFTYSAAALRQDTARTSGACSISFAASGRSGEHGWNRQGSAPTRAGMDSLINSERE